MPGKPKTQTLTNLGFWKVSISGRRSQLDFRHPNSRRTNPILVTLYEIVKKVITN